MKTDDVIRLANLAGARPAGMGHIKLSNSDDIERFANTIEQATAKRCVALCDTTATHYATAYGDGYNQGALDSAFAIRADFELNETPPQDKQGTP